MFGSNCLYSVLLHTLFNEWQKYKHSKYLFSGTGARKETSSHHKVIDYRFKMYSLYRFYSCSAKFIKTVEEDRMVDYILVSFVAG